MTDRRLLAVPLVILMAVSVAIGSVLIRSDIPSGQGPEFRTAIPDRSRPILPDLGDLQVGPLHCGTWNLFLPPACLGTSAALLPGPAVPFPVQPSPIPR